MKSFSSRPTSGRGVACPPAFLPSRGRRPAREIATRELRSEWSISRPALALPPPTGTAARPRASKPARALRSLRCPPHRRRCVAVRVWARRRPRAPQPGLPIPPAASNRAGLVVSVLPGQAPPRPQAQPLTSLIPEPTPNFARKSPTTASSFELRSLELQRFWALLKLHPIELRATFLRPGSAVTFGLCGQVLRLEVRSVSLVSSMLGCSRGLRERKIAPASHRVVVWGASVKEISPQHAENGWKLGILGVCGR